jgi:geranylgeranyl pyrophosphate synthase
MQVAIAGSMRRSKDKLNTGKKKYKAGMAISAGAILITEAIEPVAAPIKNNKKNISILGIR